MTNKLTNNHQFKLIQSTQIKEINGTAHIYKHEKMGTQVLYLQNDDDNKVFTAAFATPPTDHTGVAHIVEHCVLSGSRKYHTKEPFMDLIKGSLQTFLNAMTFSDKTIYPVASRNDKDFSQLVDVYLDSVFFPRIYEDKSIFMQEGWSYKINNEDEPLEFNGVVYNEMKGAYSDPFSELSDAISSSLFPNTCYAFSSGGRPENITDLTYEKFLEFHKKHYHPSDSKLLFYGDLNIDTFLNHIENDYLAHFKPQKKDTSWIEDTLQSPITSPIEKISYYPISSDDSPDNKYWIAQNFAFGDKPDEKLALSADILNKILISSTAAPLKLALLDENLGEDIIGFISDSRQIGFSIITKNTNLSNKDKFIDTIDKTLKNLVKNGINKDLVNGSIQSFEYKLREGSQFAIKGLMHHINLLSHWLYDEDPISPLQYETLLHQIKEEANNGYFESLIERYLLDNNHRSTVILTPQKNLNENKEKESKNKLEKIKNELSDNEIEELINQTQKLIQKQITPDSKETIATIPKLTRDDLKLDIKPIPQEVIKKDDYIFLYHDIFTSGISYVDIIFDIQNIDYQYLPYISIFCSLLGKLDTTEHNYSELSNEISLHTGTVSITPQTYSPINKESEYKLKLIVHTKYLENKHLKPIELLKEIITQTKFTDKKRIKDLIQKQKSSFENVIIYSGNEYSARRSLSHISSEAKCSEALYGIAYYQTICNILSENKIEHLCIKMQELQKIVFTKNNLHISFTGDKKLADEFIDDINILTDMIATKPESTKSDRFKINPKPIVEALSSTSMVQFVSQTANYVQLGYEYMGNMKVLSSYLNAVFLHNKVRAQGGAYGCGIQIGISGNMSITSYRDPKMFETIEVYSQIAEHLSNLSISEEELEPFIISTFGKTDPALTPRGKGLLAISRYFMDIKESDIKEQRSSILKTTPKTLKSYSEFFKTLLKTKNICILGNESKIRNKKDDFDIITNLEI